MLDLVLTENPFLFTQGTAPVLVSIPHNGSLIPAEIADTMTNEGVSSRDTDWFLDRLYDFTELDNASKLIANYSRYVIDLNRPSNDESLYPGQTTTGLIPKTCFDGSGIYIGESPTEADSALRIKKIWTPYHDQLRTELERIRHEHGIAVLIEAHSIKSVVPRLFDGKLPDFNIGTNLDKNCDPSLTRSLEDCLQQQDDYSYVVNGRFIGGFITREYGQPKNNIHSVQIELSQATYMDESNLEWDEKKAALVQPVFQRLIQAISNWIGRR